ncbi:uncharacterized protein TNCV_2347991 [Trichonephila clavipes]|uniref:Reverse transcriptase domain-containing protein n=1 Tax=Trichonephila clavipes TaxID=2585209 RepID=A0A8X6SLY9_TRICX|nr:uncharacterized protein TNCV_2347991 [Trichonephila clavipes]
MLISNGVSVNTIPDIANTLAETFAKTSSCDNYTPAFQALKRREERMKLHFSSSNERGYNSPLTLFELRVALHRSGSTKAGPDGLHYIMLQHLSESSILSLLSFFYRIWETQVFLTQWCHAHILPFPKPGKEPISEYNYHPIALTSCLSKLMEHIVSARLMFHLESHNLLSPLQSGFRKSILPQTISFGYRLPSETLLSRNSITSLFSLTLKKHMTYLGGTAYLEIYMQWASEGICQFLSKTF